MDYFYLVRENLSLGNYKEADKNLNLFFSAKDYKNQIKTNNIAYLSYIYKLNTMENLKEQYSEIDTLKLLLKAKKKTY